MSLIFGKTSMALVKTIGDEELRPVRCFSRANKIRRFSILEKKSRFLFLESDVPHEVSLMNILESSSSVPDTAVRVPFQLSDTVIQKHKAGASLKAGVDVSISGEVMEFQGSSFQYQIVTTPYETWTELQKWKVLDPEPAFLRQCRERSINLYVVTETVELLNSPVLHDVRSMNILAKFSIPMNTFVKGEGVGEGHKVRATKLTLPQGTVMAYKMKQLVFKETGWEILHIANEKQKTFPEWECEIQILSGRAQRSCWLDFGRLQEEVSWYVKKAQLLEDMGAVVFSSILAMLGDWEALEGLEDKLEQKPLGHLDGPGGVILNALRESSSYQWFNSEDSILYLLEAINGLSDLQHDLLAWSMEKKVLLQQRDLVRSILEPNFKYPWNIPFTMKPELLAPLRGEALAITYGLLEECGLTMEPNSPRSTWDLEAKKPLSALYAALSVLQQLAEA
uniref:Gasdermin C n=1 Tax=Rousettus aegyptiacus TaxID=9407 RepID=A0A7J8C1X3_ROUAE|nr:gasdermin C [Rousettus aegyptiacus]